MLPLRAVAAALWWCLAVPILAQQEAEDPQLLLRGENDIMWCCLSAEELEKCRALADATRADHERDEYVFGSYYRPIKCKHVRDDLAVRAALQEW